MGKEQLTAEERQGCLPCLREPRLLHSIGGCGEEDHGKEGHGQPRRVGGNCRPPERTACRREFGPDEANRANLKSVSSRTREAQRKFQRAKNARCGFYLQKGNKGSP